MSESKLCWSLSLCICIALSLKTPLIQDKMTITQPCMAYCFNKPLYDLFCDNDRLTVHIVGTIQ